MNKYWIKLIIWFASFFSYKRITGNQDTIYLIRYYLFRKFGISLFLHNFKRPDNEPVGTLHTHQWKWSISFVLSGGYTEERLIQVSNTSHRWYNRMVLPFRLNIFRTGDAHRISELHGEVWTLFLVGPKRSEPWGFLVPEQGFIPWQTYLNDND